jgi:TonB family protein
LRAIRKSGELRPVGFYRTQSSDALEFRDEDITIARDHFSDPHSAFLVIHHTSQGADNAAIFYWENGSIRREFPFLEFPSQARSSPTGDTQPESAQERPVALPAIPTPRPIPFPKSSRWQVQHWMQRYGRGTLIAGLALAVLFVLAVRIPRRGPAPVPAAAPPATSIAASTVAPPSPSLGLRFQRRGSDLAVTWDRDAAARLGASAGLLTVRTGAKERVIGLNTAQLNSANVLLSPEGAEVNILLTFLLPGQQTVSESGLALLSNTGQADRVIVKPEYVPPAPPAGEEEAQRSSRPPLRSFKPPNLRTAAARPRLEDPPFIPTSEMKLPPTGFLLSRAGASIAAPMPVSHMERVKPVQVIPGAPPKYPAAAKSAGVFGTVVIDLVINEAGKIKSSHLVSGHPLLQSAAMQAVYTWNFKPATIDGRPIEGPARVELNFRRN